MSAPAIAMCGAAGCGNKGKFVCKRCKVKRYCCSDCQLSSWPAHKLECKGVVEEPYAFDFSYDRSITEEVWLRSEMQKGPAQPMDPSEEYDFYHQWWNDREVVIGGQVVVKSSFCPPALKDIIRQGLRNKDITWEYLFSDNFMHIITYSWVPLQYVLEIMQNIVLPAERKPRIQGMVEVIVEHFWRVRGMPGQLDYDPEVGAMLRRHKVTLPFTDSHCYEDEFRQYTHALGAPFPSPCTCFSCSARPFKEARMRESWEVLRRKAAKKGLFMMSWESKLEFESMQQQGQGNDGTTARDATKASVSSTSSASVNPSRQSVDMAEKDKALGWQHGADETQTLKSTLTKKELGELATMIDTIVKQQRLPTHSEMDAIMSKLSVSKEQYAAETRRDALRAMAASAAASSTTGNANGASASAVGATITVPAAGGSATSGSATTGLTAASVLSVKSAGVVKPQRAATVTPSRQPLTAQDQQPRTGEKASAAADGDLAEQCTTQLSAVELNRDIHSAGPSDFTTDTHKAEAPWSLVADRPKRRSAAKVVSYAEGGSSDDSIGAHRRHRSSASTSTAGTMDSTPVRRNDYGDGDGSDGESSQWSDSAASTSENDGSEDAPISSEESDGQSDSRGATAKRSIAKASSTAGGGGKVKQAKRRAAGTLSKSTRLAWTAEMDARLTEGFAMYKEKGGWAGVAEYVGGEATARKCNNRWSTYLSKFQQEGIKQGDWSDGEVGQLQELVPQHVIKTHWNKLQKAMTQDRTDWTAIGQQLNRVPMDCHNKWRRLEDGKLKKGPFTTQEDALIRQRVAEWGDKGNGLWVSLQKEIGRGSAHISHRWTTVLIKG